MTVTLVAAMAAAIVIAGVGWYDAERRCAQWQRQAERHQRRRRRPTPGAISSGVTLTGYQEAHSILAGATPLYAAHTTLIRERLAANYTLIAANVEEAHGQLSVDSTAPGCAPQPQQYGCADSHRSIVSARCPPRSGLIYFSRRHMNEERTTLEKTGRCRRRYRRPDAQLRRHSQCAGRRHRDQRAQRRLARDRHAWSLPASSTGPSACGSMAPTTGSASAWRPRMCRR